MTSPTSSEYQNEQANLNNLLAVLAAIRMDHDVVRAQEELFLIAQTQIRLSQLARQLLPFTFTYLATNGKAYPAFNGNALQSSWAPLLIPTSPLPEGVTYGDIVFDVPYMGGVIRMTDPFNSAVATWTLS